MTMYQDKPAPLRRISDITPEEVAAHVREARRLRSQAIASVASALARRLRSLGRTSSPPGSPVGRPV